MNVRLPADVYSPDQIGIALWELSAVIDQLRNAATRGLVAGEAAPPAETHVSSFLLSILHASKVSSTDYPSLEKLQAELKELRVVAPVAHIVVAALPSRSLKREIVEWLRSEINPDHLVTFAARSDIGGGFLLRIGSKQYDFTYRERLLADKPRLVELFDNVR